ncbi:hypothetical protein HYC85_019122 [Camellia sinensis]|uniref:Mitochondrial carrier protein n=1 Tax=Camellia sinensis TaxID=4442 RepID=A0A7J7GLC0_CAMSI|nr:hypothetical protein HYC85_019122 [Camellia sinensis]
MAAVIVPLPYSLPSKNLSLVVGVMEEPGQLKRAFVDATAGAIAGGISRTVTSPLDVIKIRFQVQLEPTTSWALLHKDVYAPSKYTGMLQATKDIFREEGLRGFWRGNVPALLMVMPYTAIQFTVLHKLKTFAAGSSKTAGCAATVGSYPFDLLRTILASQGEPKVYPTMRSAFVDIIKTRGFRGLYAGLSPTLVEIIPYAGLQFGTYDTFKRWVMDWNRWLIPNVGVADESLSSFQLFICGLAAGTCAKVVCHPLDVVKKRFQVFLLKDYRDTRGMELELNNTVTGICMMHFAGFYKWRVGLASTRVSSHRSSKPRLPVL